MSEEARILLGVMIVLAGFNISHKTEPRSIAVWVGGLLVGAVGLFIAMGIK